MPSARVASARNTSSNRFGIYQALPPLKSPEGILILIGFLLLLAIFGYLIYTKRIFSDETV